MKILLDTCAFLWVIAGDDRLSKRAAEHFLDAENEVYLSPVSAWEIAVKHSLGKLALPEPPEIFLPEQRERHGIGALPLDENSALFFGRLPAIHTDPFDRMLVCQALANGMAILTPDENIRKYPVLTIW